MTIQQTNPPENSDVLRELKRDIFTSFNAINIGRIEAFDTSEQSATIQLSLKKVESENPDGTLIIKERPVLLKCPVVVLTGGVSHITLPIEAGDDCLVLFNDREIDNWFNAGHSVIPTTNRKHDVSDALAIVGIRNIQTAITDYLVNGLRVRYNASSQIQFTQDKIDSIADLFEHAGSMLITKGLEVQGNSGTKVLITCPVDIDGTVDITGAMDFEGDLIFDGKITQTGDYDLTGNVTLTGDFTQNSPGIMKAGNGASGTFINSVVVLDGIVVGGT